MNIIQQKQCTVCGEIKSISEFNKDSSRKDGFYHTCVTCRKDIRSKNKDKIKATSKKYYDENKNMLLSKNKQYRTDNSEILNARSREYYSNHRKYMIAINVEYERNKMQTDPNFRLVKNLRRRIYSAVKNSYKSDSTMNLIGCDIPTLKIHLQNTAIYNEYIDFDINNYSGKDYHIDHIIPCCNFDLSDPEQQKLCFHYSNLQILTTNENLKKGGKLS